MRRRVFLMEANPKGQTVKPQFLCLWIAVIIVLPLCFKSCTVFYPCVEEPSGKDVSLNTQESLNLALRKELLEMMREDQEVRKALLEAEFADPLLLSRAREVDRRNTNRMRKIVDTEGWPGKSLVGEDGASAAWLLVQHADHDLWFQKHCLALMKKAAQKGDMPMKDVAYLMDRVLIAEGKKQCYGTQFDSQGGELLPLPIEDEANVDARRREVGLPPLKDYEKALKEIYPSKDLREK